MTEPKVAKWTPEQCIGAAKYDADDIVNKDFLISIKNVVMPLIEKGDMIKVADRVTRHRYIETVDALIAGMDRFMASNPECRLTGVMDAYTDRINLLWHYKDALEHEKLGFLGKLSEEIVDVASPHVIDPHKFDWVDLTFLGTCALLMDALLAVGAYRVLYVSVPGAWAIGAAAAILQGATAVYVNTIKTDECLE